MNAVIKIVDAYKKKCKISNHILTKCNEPVMFNLVKFTTQKILCKIKRNVTTEILTLYRSCQNELLNIKVMIYFRYICHPSYNY